MYSDLHIYIDLNWKYYIENDSTYSENLYHLVEFAHIHKVTLYASRLQIESFKANCDEFEEYFNTSHADFLDILTENTIFVDCENNIFEICYSDENTSLNNIENQAISSISENSKCSLVSISEKSSHKCYIAIKSSCEFWKLELEICNSREDLHKWILLNTSVRNFNLSEKHGENGVGNWNEASKLLCNKDEAQKMLNKAIPNFIEKNKRLFYFDENHETYLEFYFEGDNPQNQWHGFHLEKKNWNRVPLMVREYFRRIK